MRYAFVCIDGRRNSHSLLFASRELRREVIHSLAQSDALQQLTRACRDFARTQTSVQNHGLISGTTRETVSIGHTLGACHTQWHLS